MLSLHSDLEHAILATAYRTLEDSKPRDYSLLSSLVEDAMWKKSHDEAQE